MDYNRTTIEPAHAFLEDLDFNGLGDDPALDTSQLIEDFRRESRAALDQSLLHSRSYPLSGNRLGKHEQYYDGDGKTFIREEDSFLHDRTGRLDFQKVRLLDGENHGPNTNWTATPSSVPRNPFQSNGRSILTPPDTTVPQKMRPAYTPATIAGGIMQPCISHSLDERAIQDMQALYEQRLELMEVHCCRSFV